MVECFKWRVCFSPNYLCLIVSMLYISHEIISLSLRLCSKLQIQSKMDSAYLLESLAGNFMDVVQYNEDNRAFEVCEWVHIVDHTTF